MTRLGVWKEGQRVGTLARHDQESLSFQYDDHALENTGAAISIRLPPRALPYGDRDAYCYFENLLPEQDIRRIHATVLKRSQTDIVGLLGDLAGECHGAVSLWPDDMVPPPQPTYVACDAHVLRGYFSGSGDIAGVDLTRASRQSLGGAQRKVVLKRTVSADGTPFYELPCAGAPTNVVVKHEPATFPGLLQNELYCMRLGRRCGLTTAEARRSGLLPTAFETDRFDRITQSDGVIRRLHQEDGCQVLGLASRLKYFDNGGPTYQNLVAMLTRHGIRAREDGVSLLRWALFNLSIGNFDAHAKNLAFLHDSGGVRLAPHYDLVCTLAYDGLDTSFPIRLGGIHHTNMITAAFPRVVARELRVAPALVQQTLEELDVQLRSILLDCAHEITQEAGDHEVLAVCVDRITRQLDTIRARLQ